MYYEVELNPMGLGRDGESLTTDEDEWPSTGPTHMNIFVTSRDEDDEIQEMLDIDIPIKHKELAYRLCPIVEVYFNELELMPPEMTPEEWLSLQYEADARAAALEDQDVF